MSLNHPSIFAAATLAAAALIPLSYAAIAPRPPAPVVSPSAAPSATQPKSLTGNVNNGLKWLIAHQGSDGGWGQGEESSQMGNSLDALKDKSNVGDTCIAVLALLRSGSTPADGPYAGNIRRGIDFVCSEVDKAPADGLSITSVNGTRLQMKLGPNIDTFLSSLMLGEIRNKMPDEAAHKKAIAALDKVLDKIEKNIKNDGQIAQGGWAGGIAQGIASKGANTAAMNGGRVSDETLRRFEDNAAAKQNADGTTKMGADVAGVQLYATASNVTALDLNDKRLALRAGELKAQLDAPSTAPAERDRLQKDYNDVTQRLNTNRENLRAATVAVAKQANDDRFISGFGSNGGEEFLSYLNLGETLFTTGGDEWKKWDTKMTENLNNIQNKDGSWSGQHCITGRTFCTSAALMVLMIDRENAQIAGQIHRRS
jgi:hypothetical protein